ncbi:MAG TPA: hypothetical protein VEI03_13340 [Stellaceae bacterium]|nr:hypothetical protein [Stellaceae bacterium]
MFRQTILAGRAGLLAGTALAMSGALAPGMAQNAFIPDTLVVSRIVYNGDTNPARAGETFPTIFNDPNVSGIQGSIFLDSYLTVPFSPRLASFPLTQNSARGTIITTSFSSKSEGSLHLSTNGQFLTYMGYVGPVGVEGVSNSETTLAAAQITGAAGPFFDRAVALVKYDGTFLVQNENDAYSGDNPRGAISIDGTQFYMAGNADSTENKTTPVTGPGTTIGARLGHPGSSSSIQLGTYLATDRPDESAKQHIKDNNWRGIGIFNGNLYVSKGSGGNGDDGVFQVEDGTGNGVPTGGTTNTIVQLLGTQATNPITGASSPLTPFGFFFADANTLYVADEGNSTITTTEPGGTVISSTTSDGTTTYTDLVSDPLAGLQKWSLIGGVWTLDYVLQDGLGLNQPVDVPGYGVPTYTTGLRNLTGRVNGEGTVTIYAITAQTSSISGGEPDPTRLVAITDRLAATSLPLPPEGGFPDDGLETFVTLQASRSGEVFRGVAFAPCASCETP